MPLPKWILTCLQSLSRMFPCVLGLHCLRSVPDTPVLGLPRARGWFCHLPASKPPFASPLQEAWSCLCAADVDCSLLCGLAIKLHGTPGWFGDLPEPKAVPKDMDPLGLGTSVGPSAQHAWGFTSFPTCTQFTLCLACYNLRDPACQDIVPWCQEWPIKF